MVRYIALLLALAGVSGCSAGSSRVDAAQPDAPSGAPIRLLITIDVEALPQRQGADHLQRLVYGRFEGHEVGIVEMMRIADRYGVKLTFFLDYCEVPLYGEQPIRDVAMTILSHGHDLQMHCHPTLLPASFWASVGVEPPDGDQDRYSAAQATEVVRFVVRESVACGNPNPLAYRGGGFRYNEHILGALRDVGVPAAFNYNWQLWTQRDSQRDLPAFQWSNGVLEFPLSVCAGGWARTPLDLSALVDGGSVARAHQMIERHARKHGKDDVVVMIGHSWGFLDRSLSSGFFYYKDDSRRDAFELFLRSLPRNVRVVTASEVVRQAQAGELRLVGNRDTSVAGRTANPLLRRVAGASRRMRQLFARAVGMEATCDD